MSKLLKKFCKSPSKSIFNQLDETTQQQLVIIAFDVMYQKTGNQKKALEILSTVGEVEVINDYIIYNGRFDLDPLESLIRIGVTTLPVIPNDKLSSIRKEFDETLKKFPEYLRNPTTEPVYVLGGFAALGNPASFHNTLVRKLRVMCWKKAIKLFHKMINRYYDTNLKNNYKVEVLYDRMMYRKTGQKAVAEAWHRDVMPPSLILDQDEIYGGWINLDSTDQYFSCIPGSHLGIIQRGIPSGFNTMEKRESAKLLKNIKVKEAIKKLTKVQKEKYINNLVKPIMAYVSQKKHKFKIPPGHMVIFPQYIMHEVVANAVKHDMYRLFLGWRITISDKSLLDNDYYMKNQAVVPLPGGMIPPMYSASHQSQQLGIPTLKKMNEVEKKNFNMGKWSQDLNDKYIQLYPTDQMKKLSKRLEKTKNKKKIIAKMNKEYLDVANIKLDFDEEKFVNDKDMTISFRSVFKTNPHNNETKTTLIKWSQDTIPEKFLTKQIYNGIGGKGEYMKAPRYMKSLKELNLRMYPKYNDQEKIIYKPNRVT
jgi:hypothetical protein